MVVVIVIVVIIIVIVGEEVLEMGVLRVRRLWLLGSCGIGD